MFMKEKQKQKLPHHKLPKSTEWVYADLAEYDSEEIEAIVTGKIGVDYEG